MFIIVVMMFAERGPTKSRHGFVEKQIKKNHSPHRWGLWFFLICFSTKPCLLLVGPRSANIITTMMNTRDLRNTMRAVGS